MKLLALTGAVAVLLCSPVRQAEAAEYAKATTLRLYNAPLTKLTDRQLRRERHHSSSYVRFMRWSKPGRYHTAFRHRTCRTVEHRRRGQCFYLRNRVRFHQGVLVTIRKLLAPPAPAISLGPLNCISCWDRVASCESGGNWSIDTGNGFLGGLQWMLGTWLAYGGGRYASTPVLASRLQQISVASHMSLSHWPVCGARY